MDKPNASDSVCKRSIYRIRRLLIVALIVVITLSIILVKRVWVVRSDGNSNGSTVGWPVVPQQISFAKWLVIFIQPGDRAPDIVDSPLDFSVSRVEVKDVGADGRKAIDDYATSQASAQDGDDVEVYRVGVSRDFLINNLSSTQSIKLVLADDEIVAARTDPVRKVGNSHLWSGVTDHEEPLQIAVSEMNLTVTLPGGWYLQSVPNQGDLAVHVTGRSFEGAGPDLTGRSASSDAYRPQPALRCKNDVGDRPKSSSAQNNGSQIVDVGLIVSPLAKNKFKDTEMDGARAFLQLLSKDTLDKYGVEINLADEESISGTSDPVEADRLLWNDIFNDTRKSPLWGAIEERVKTSAADLAVYVSDSSVLLPQGGRVGGSVYKCGHASLLANKDRYLAIVDARCLKSGTIIAHEIGHLLGGTHEPHMKMAGNQRTDHGWRWPRTPTVRETLAITMGLAEEEIYPYIGTIMAMEVAYRIPATSDPGALCGRASVGHRDTASHGASFKTSAAAIARLSDERSASFSDVTEPSPPPVDGGSKTSGTTNAVINIATTQDELTLGENRRVQDDDSVHNDQFTDGGGASGEVYGGITSKLCESVSREPPICSSESFPIGQTLTFKTGVWMLSDQHMLELRQFAERNSLEGRVVVVSGHASATGSTVGNMRLARNRANSVSSGLDEVLKSSKQRAKIRVCSHGADLPRCSTIAEDTANQRVTLQIVKER